MRSISGRATGVVFVAVAILAWPAAGHAAIVADLQSLAPPSYSLSEVNEAGGILVGDKLFDQFTVTTTQSVGAIAPGLDEIEVTGVLIDNPLVHNELGLRFSGGWSAPKGKIADSTITFRISIVEPQRSQGFLIADNSLWMDAYGISGDGYVSISENVYAADPRLGPTPSVAKKLVFSDGETDQFFDHEDFMQNHQPAALAEIWVVKDVIANGGTEVGSFGHLSQFYNTFSQIPEPASLGLMAIGLAAILVRRRR